MKILKYAAPLSIMLAATIVVVVGQSVIDPVKDGMLLNKLSKKC